MTDEQQSSKIVVNIRNLGGQFAGVQRYTTEILGRLPHVEPIRPSRRLRGILGHVWEQAILPGRVGRRLLWSPSNTGPLRVRRQVVTVHDLVALEHPQSFQWSFRQWYSLLLPRLLKVVQRIITPSRFTRDRIVHVLGVPDEKIVVIANGVGEQFRARPRADMESTCRALQLPSNRYILMLGSVEPRKNCARVLEAWRRLLAVVAPDLWLVVAGAVGPSHVFAANGVSRIPDRVRFIGAVKDDMLPALYHGASLFINASLYEGFGLPALEAMAMGVPVISSARGAAAEVLGDAAVYFDPLDVDALASVLARVLKDGPLLRDLANRGAVRAAHFSWSRSAQLTWELLEREAGVTNPVTP